MCTFNKQRHASTITDAVYHAQSHQHTSTHANTLCLQKDANNAYSHYTLHTYLYACAHVILIAEGGQRC